MIRNKLQHALQTVPALGICGDHTRQPEPGWLPLRVDLQSFAEEIASERGFSGARGGDTFGNQSVNGERGGRLHGWPLRRGVAKAFSPL
jgi:hypothetical protein